MGGGGGGGGQKGPPTSFYPVTSTNVGISAQNFLTFSANPKLLNLNQDHSSKKRFFWSSPYEIEVVIASLIVMLELPNFGHMTTSTI